MTQLPKCIMSNLGLINRYKLFPFEMVTDIKLNYQSVRWTKRPKLLYYNCSKGCISETADLIE
jgi:hypothetical protein